MRVTFLRNIKILIEMVSGTKISKHPTKNITLESVSRNENDSCPPFIAAAPYFTSLSLFMGEILTPFIERFKKT